MSEKLRNISRIWEEVAKNVSMSMYVCVESFFPLQVPQGLQAGGYDCLKPQKCPHCSHYGPINPNTRHGCHSNTAGPHAEGGVVVKVGHIVDSSHQASCHGAVRCHWLHGSNESSSQKPMQRHVVTVRCVFGYRHFERGAYSVADGALDG